MNTKNIVTCLLISMFSITTVFAFAPKETAKYFNGPTVTNITQTSAVLSLSSQVLKDISVEDQSQVYFEYIETHKACIMIYPTPTECLPKKTPAGVLTTYITNLQPGTSYTAWYKRDNSIQCVTTPCPGNGFESMQVTFTTKGGSTNPGNASGMKPVLNRNLGQGMRGADVKKLQDFLVSRGYLQPQANTGYYGVLTVQAVKAYQQSKGIKPTGFTGILTREIILEE